MALSKTSQQDNRGSTELAQKLDFSNSKYNFNYLVFPDDLGMMDNGHYMVININVPTDSAGNVAGKLDPYLTSQNSGRNFGFDYTPLGTNEWSKVDRLRFGQDQVPGVENSGIAIPGVGKRYTRRIAESIALYMPRPLIYNTNNVYEDISLTALAGRLGIGLSDFARGTAAASASMVSRAGAAAAGLTGLISSGIASQLARQASMVAMKPINPTIEILFSNTTQRQFVFEFLLAPRSESESLAVKKIIQTIRYHAAPEIGGGIEMLGNIGAALTWIPPAEFDITFYNKGVENLNILRINTCVLERVEVDYAPSGVYSTFTNGHPVAARLSMGFREIEPIHKLRVLQGF